MMPWHQCLRALAVAGAVLGLGCGCSAQAKPTNYGAAFSVAAAQGELSWSGDVLVSLDATRCTPRSAFTNSGEPNFLATFSFELHCPVPDGNITVIALFTSPALDSRTVPIGEKAHGHGHRLLHSKSSAG